MAVDLTPSDAMASAAKRGLDLAANGKGGGGLEPATKSRAKKIASKAELSMGHVKRMASFFARHSVDRKSDWGKAGSETPGYVAWQLWGGDAGKAWASARVKQLSEHGIDMDEIDEDEDDLDLDEEVVLDEDKQDFLELFVTADTAQLADVKADKDGLIWKPMLPVGIWNVGPNGRPLKVVAGRSKDQRKEIGMQDVIDAFDAQAVPHVTVPLSHEDKTDENTGYIRKVKVATINGIKTLMGGHHFTDKKVEGKVTEGSIANTSVGLEFDYVRKDDGKKFPIILRHNALTNRPWLGRKLAPFGLAEDQAGNYSVMCGEYAGNIIEEPDPEAVTASIDDKSTSGTQDTIQTSEVVDDPTHKEPVMAEENKKDEPAKTVDLTDHPDFIAEREKSARLAAQLEQLAEKDRQRDAVDFVGVLKEMGFTEEKGCTGFLKETKAIMLADTGETALLLSEDGKAAPSAMTVTTVLKRLFATLPGQDGKAPVATQLSEQATDPLQTSKDEKPAPKADEKELSEMTLAEKEAAADAWFEENYPGAKTTTKKEA